MICEFCVGTGRSPIHGKHPGYTPCPRCGGRGTVRRTFRVRLVNIRPNANTSHFGTTYATQEDYDLLHPFGAAARKRFGEEVMKHYQEKRQWRF